MSSYRGAGGPWDGGPPGAEAEYATQQNPTPYAQQPTRGMPSTDPWTGVSYTQYGQSTNFHYSQYNSGYNYNYENNYYQRPDGSYMNYGTHSSHPSYPQGPSSYNYPLQPSVSPSTSRNYEAKRSYKSKSRSLSPYEKRNRAYSSDYDDRRRDRSRSRSKRNKRYSSSDSSRSKSRSPSQLSNRKDKKSRSSSTNSSLSDRSSRNKKYNRNRGHKGSRTPPLKHKSPDNRSTSGTPSKESIKSMSRRSKSVDKKGRGSKKYSEKKSKTMKHKKDRDLSSSPSKGYKKGDKPVVKIERPSVTPPQSYLKRESSRTPQRNKHKVRKFETPPRKEREGTLTPPKSYIRKRSTSSSGTPSRSPTPKHSSRKRSCTPENSRSSSSPSLRRSRSKTLKRKSVSRSRSRSKSYTRRRSRARSRSKSRRRSKSKAKGRRSRSPSRSVRSHSKSRSGSRSDDERRGQFTVADRKRYWKLQRSKQVIWESKTPPKEVKPPPGAIEQNDVDDIEYGDPPEVEGPNFAELLPPPDQLSQPSGSKSKSTSMPIKNDGSFLEMFKKMQAETKKAEVSEKKNEMKKPVLPFIGKRRGGRVLKTGLVKKAKAIDEQSVDNTPKDAWSLYMQEVKKYRETSCEEERKTRPLVK